MQGGKGMAGTGKRAGQKKTWVLKYAPEQLGKRGFASLKKLKHRKNEINLDEIEIRIEKFIKEGIAKRTGEGIELKLKGYKVLSRGEVKEKLMVKADSFSEKAKEKIEKAGGSVVADTCMVVSPIEEMGYKVTGVDSGKAANYLPGFCKQEVVFADINKLIEVQT